MALHTGRNLSRYARLLILAATMLSAAILTPRDAGAAMSEQVLYPFCPQPFNGCPDGGYPYASLIMDGAGNLYGTATSFGAHNNGVVFQLTPNQNKTAWTQTVLYSFCAQANCTDGAAPHGALLMDGAGNLYGTTANGGNAGSGTVFQLTPNLSYSVLYSFCAQPSCADGSYPYSNLIMDGAGALYGTASNGGSGTAGVVFRLGPSHTYSVIYNFCSQPGCHDGAQPWAGLIMDKAGNLYGTTNQGGNVGGGTVFELSPNIAHTAYTETVLAHDLGGPYGGVLMDGTGTLYGTTVGGGTHGAGTVFRLTPNLNKTAWVRTVLYNFCAQPSCADGSQPYASLIMDNKGSLYSTVFDGGANHVGGVFQVTPNLAKTAWTYTLLYSFCSLSGCADGARSYAGLLADGLGNLYGAAYASGPNNVGLIFSLGPGSLCGTGGRMCVSPLGAVPAGARLH